MKLLGWDTVSAISYDLANQALEAGHERLLTSFNHNREGLKLRGEFGPWRIVPGGSMRNLHLEIFVRQGKASGLGRPRAKPKDLSGMTLRVEIPLGLIPSPDGKAPAELRFELGDDDSISSAVIPLGLNDPAGRLDELERELVQLGLSDCLSKNRDKIGFVFAAITPGAGGGVMQTPHLDWASLSTGDGRNYLAIFGSRKKPTAAMTPDKIDPELVAGQGAAYFACSRGIYAENILVPWLSQNFKPKANFRPGGQFAVLAKSVKLPKVGSPIGQLSPYISAMKVGPNMGGLLVDLQSVTPLNKSVRVVVHMKIRMRMFVDGNGRIGLKKDPKPIIKHEVEGSGVFGGLLAGLVKLILKFSGTNIQDIARNLATKFQTMNTPAAQPVLWTGTRPFVTTQAKSEECLWFSDDRPA
jgi:hypothetical protein